MASVTLNSTIFERLAAGLYGIQLGSATLVEATNAALFLSTVEPGSDGVNTLANVLYKRDFGNQSDHAVAVSMVANMGITGALATSSVTLVENALGGVNADHKGEVVMTIINNLSAAEADATYGASAKAFNLQVKAALDYAAHNVGDVSVKSLLPIFHLDPMTAAGADSMRLTGNEDISINFSNPANQITGMDLNGDGTIKADGVENHITGMAANYEIVDAYPRNPLNHSDTANNFLGDLLFHGEGFDGDGTNTNGNIVLGGLGVDDIYAGIGNDFLAGGGVAQGVSGYDALHGGRNADFFFAEFDPIDATDGKQLFIDGGSTADDTAAGTHSSQDSDWLLLEATDDDEPVTVELEEEQFSAVAPLPFEDVDVFTRSGKSMDVEEVENFDASGNLYGFLDGVNVKIGARAVDDRDTSDAAVGSNYGYGSSAQLFVSGSEVGNIIVGGYDNDRINGNDGDDLLMGGNLNFLKNPNLAGIWNNGQDEIYGGAGDDNIVFETDGGIYEGGSVANNDKDKIDNNDPDTTGGNDTLWLTRETFGMKSAGDVTSDGTLRIDLAAGKQGGIDNSAGYGGADAAARTGNYTADQTNYKVDETTNKAVVGRAQVQDMDNVIATGLGAVDYLAAGTNDPELKFTNEQNHYAFSGNLDLRGSDGDNILYAVGGADVIEGRMGNDDMSGGAGSDDFYFQIDNNQFTAGEDDDPWDRVADTVHDGVDVIRRQVDKTGPDGKPDNIWDTDNKGNLLYGPDFGEVGNAVTSNSKLTLTLIDAAHPSDLTGFPVNGVVFKLDGVSYTVSLAHGVQGTYAAFKDGLNEALDANTTLARLNAQLNGDNTITITDPSGKAFVSVGYTFVDNVVPPAGTLTWDQKVGDPESQQSKDRLIYKSYEDRHDNEGTDDDSFVGSIISLGTDAYAEDLVINFADEDGDGLKTTRIAEDQLYHVSFTNLTTQDKVQITINGVKYALQVGVDLDGNIIDNEDTSHYQLATVQTNFVARLAGYIDNFMDNDTSAGQVGASANGSTIDLWQRTYDGEQTVFDTLPAVLITDLSGGEKPSYSVVNDAQSEVELYDFNGLNGALNASNVLFIGQEGVSRSTLETATTAGGKTIVGKEAIVIDTGADNLKDFTYDSLGVTTTTVPNNTASNLDLSDELYGFAVHGDDFLLSAAGLDTIKGGTGDDRIEGSMGGNKTTTWDSLDGGKNFYAVQILGESQARVYVLNQWEATSGNWNKTGNLLAGLIASGLTLTSVTLIDQTEDGHGTDSGVFRDTLQFSQANFTSGVSRFTVILDDFVNSGTATAPVIELTHSGAGWVGVDLDGNGAIEATNGWTKFAEFENIRTVSGVGRAVAGDGQGNDTLDVTLLSTTAGGISYNLTNDGGAGEVKYSSDPFITAPTAPTLPGTSSTDRPQSGDFDQLVINVDGVESVLGGTGNDLLLIDETEAAKDNLFSAGLGVDRVEYSNDFVAGNPDGVAEPTMTIKVNSATDTDTVIQKGGRVGTLNTATGGAVDTLVGVEYIALLGETATSTREDDKLDVTSIATGAIVDYSNGEVRAVAAGGIVPGVGVQVVIENMYELENVVADGDDTVIVGDADTVMTLNSRDDFSNGTPTAKIQLSTYLDYDTFKTDKSRKPFNQQTPSEISNVINQNEFTFSLGAAVDTVDYSKDLNGKIVAVLNFKDNDPNKFVMVSGDNDDDFTDNGARIDKLVNVERIVAADVSGNSVLDATGSGRDINVIFSYNQPSEKTNFVEGTHKVSALDRQINVVRVEDAANQAALGNVDLIEYRDLGDSTTVTQNKAVWKSVEGSDFREYVELTQWEDGINHSFNLRGGKNEVNYNERTNGIRLNINSVDTADHQYWLTVDHMNADGSFNGGTDTIFGYNQKNAIGGSANAMRIEASQGDRDFINVTFPVATSGLFILGQTESSGDAVVTAIFAGEGTGLVMSGFEYLWDQSSTDVYQVNDLSDFVSKLTLIDFAQQYDPVTGQFLSSGDRDTLKLTNKSFESNVTIRPPVSQTISVTNALHMGDGAANDLQRLGVNNNTYRAAEGNPQNNGVVNVLNVSVGYDFQVLDISEVTTAATNNSITTHSITAAAGGPATRDELVVGNLDLLNNTGQAITGFDILSLTNNSVGTVFDFDITAGELQSSGSTKIVGFDAAMDTLDLSAVSGRDVTLTANSATAVTLIGGAGNDNITGSAGGDTLVGGAGNDTLNGGTATEVRQIQINPTGVTVAGPVVLNMDGQTYTLNFVAGVPVDTDPDLGDNVDATFGGGSHDVGTRLAALVSANLDELNATGAFGGTDVASVVYSNTTGLLTITFVSGIDVAVTDTISISGAGLGTVTVTGESTLTEGGGGGSDVFEFAGSAAANGSDTIVGFTPGNAVVFGDTLDFAGLDAKLNKLFLQNTVGAVITTVPLVVVGANGAVTFGDESGAVTVASALETDILNDMVFMNANGTALTAANIAAEFSAAGGATLTAFLANGVDANGAGKGMKAVIIEIDNTKTAEDAKVWFVEDANNDGTISASEVSLVATLTGAGDFNFDPFNFA